MADEFCALAKAGVLSAVSVGFRPIEAKPRGNGRGLLFSAWELLKISLVSSVEPTGALGLWLASTIGFDL